MMVAGRRNGRRSGDFLFYFLFSVLGVSMERKDTILVVCVMMCWMIVELLCLLLLSVVVVVCYVCMYVCM